LVDVFHDERKASVFHLEEQVVVVGHEAVCPDVKAKQGALFMDHVQKSQVVGVVEEYLSFVDATVDDVVEAGLPYPFWSRHGVACR